MHPDTENMLRWRQIVYKVPNGVAELIEIATSENGHQPDSAHRHPSDKHHLQMTLSHLSDNGYW